MRPAPALRLPLLRNILRVGHFEDRRLTLGWAGNARSLRGFGRNENKPASPKREARASCFRSALFRLALASRFGHAILLAVRSAFFPNALSFGRPFCPDANVVTPRLLIIYNRAGGRLRPSEMRKDNKEEEQQGALLGPLHTFPHFSALPATSKFSLPR